ncbi:YtxH domain-containing protein [Ktedonosporobacter rubrisoli]|uniref:YtxH domain-containing protein n=1 Tax=Ktedonosporobacter rubrisoli TaxID=2509675 RepID=A0A4P6JXF3_KTERU|nr:YtxH domain-containing protein [Ktedonosporobacter rubrisoli]QBD80428.1 YtxH domain-containing protein [Ktedonosporobacter rubrisoli]
MKFFVGLLLGMGVGVAVGLLIAPQSGEATRTQLSEQGILLRSGTFNDEIRARANEALAQGRELYARTKVELADRYQKARSGDL